MGFAWELIAFEKFRRKAYSYAILKCKISGKRKSPNEQMSPWDFMWTSGNAKPRRAKVSVSDYKQGITEFNKQYCLSQWKMAEL